MKKILLTALTVTFAILPAASEISTSESTSPSYLINHGHSTAVVEMVQLTKAGALGEDYVTADNLKHENDSKPVKWIRKVFIYLDPALDDGTFMRHDSAVVPNVEDL